jgi:hypothetical protein
MATIYHRARVDADMSDTPPAAEVRAYLKRLITSIVVGIVLMTLSVAWAWHRYGGRLENRAPMPADHPKALPALR